MSCPFFIVKKVGSINIILYFCNDEDETTSFSVPAGCADAYCGAGTV